LLSTFFWKKRNTLSCILEKEEKEEEEDI